MACWETFVGRLRRLRIVPPESNEKELQEELDVDTHEEAERLVRRAEDRVRVRRVLADGAYDSKANFNFLAGEGIKPVIRVAKNSVPRSNGSYARKKAVMEQQAFGPKAWSGIHRFGYRWRVGGAFSVIKRVFGEHVTARKFVNMAKEMAMKAYIYNGFIAAR